MEKEKKRFIYLFSFSEKEKNIFIYLFSFSEKEKNQVFKFSPKEK
jgi:hypothetical protein